MNWSLKSAAVLFGYATALAWLVACLAIAALQSAPADPFVTAFLATR